MFETAPSWPPIVSQGKKPHPRSKTSKTISGFKFEEPQSASVEKAYWDFTKFSNQTLEIDFRFENRRKIRVWFPINSKYGIRREQEALRHLASAFGIKGIPSPDRLVGQVYLSPPADKQVEVMAGEWFVADMLSIEPEMPTLPPPPP